MKLLKLASILMIPVAGALYGHNPAAAAGTSDAAQGCQQGSQAVSYLVPVLGGGVGGGKVHIAFFTNHGDCVNFFALHKDYVFDGIAPVSQG